jgi:hypothetical protein
MGANTWSSGTVTLANLKAYTLAWVRRMKAIGAKAVMLTQVPRTSSTDGWQTTGNQGLLTGESVRQAYNVWLMDTTANGYVATAGGSLYAGVIDVGAKVEVNTDGTAITRAANGTISNGVGGYWKTATAEASGTATGGSSTTITCGSSIFTSAMVGHYVHNLTKNSTGYITAQTGTAATVLSWNNGNPANTDSFIVINRYTWDGVHPAILGHNAMATAVTAAISHITTVYDFHVGDKLFATAARRQDAGFAANTVSPAIIRQINAPSDSLESVLAF